MEGIEFIEWSGGDRPAGLEDETRVIVLFRDGIRSRIRRAGDLRWHHEGLCDDIVGYHVVQFRETAA